MNKVVEYVCGFMFDPTYEKVVVIQKNKPEWQKGLLNGVGGKLEKNETIHEAMSREFLEETGLKTNDTDWQHYCNITASDNSYCVHFFYCINELYNDVVSIEEELVCIINVNELQRHSLIPNLRWLIPMCLDNNHIFCEAIAI